MKGWLAKITLVSIGCFWLAQSSVAGVVFTINSTDKNTGELVGSTEVLVEGTLLKMKFTESGNRSAGQNPRDSYTSSCRMRVRWRLQWPAPGRVAAHRPARSPAAKTAKWSTTPPIGK